MQRAEMEELRQREANLTALLAIGPRKKAKIEDGASPGSGSSTGAGTSTTSGVSSMISVNDCTIRNIIIICYYYLIVLALLQIQPAPCFGLCTSSLSSSPLCKLFNLQHLPCWQSPNQSVLPKFFRANPASPTHSRTMEDLIRLFWGASLENAPTASE